MPWKRTEPVKRKRSSLVTVFFSYVLQRVLHLNDQTDMIHSLHQYRRWARPPPECSAQPAALQHMLDIHQPTSGSPAQSVRPSPLRRPPHGSPQPPLGQEEIPHPQLPLLSKSPPRRRESHHRLERPLAIGGLRRPRLCRGRAEPSHTGLPSRGGIDRRRAHRIAPQRMGLLRRPGGQTACRQPQPLQPQSHHPPSPSGPAKARTGPCSTPMAPHTRGGTYGDQGSHISRKQVLR